MSHEQVVMTAIVLSRNSGHVLRKKPVTTYEELKALHKQFPRNDIGVFEDPTGETGDMWMYMPDYDPFNYAARR